MAVNPLSQSYNWTFRHFAICVLPFAFLNFPETTAKGNGLVQAHVATRLNEPEKTGEMVKEILQNQAFTKDSLGG